MCTLVFVVGLIFFFLLFVSLFFKFTIIFFFFNLHEAVFGIQEKSSDERLFQCMNECKIRILFLKSNFPHDFGYQYVFISLNNRVY